MIRQDENTTPEAKERQETDVRQMFNFAVNQSECRRVQLLQHFDERFDRTLCKKTCDTCKDDRDTVSEDVTEIARSAVGLAQSAVDREVRLTPQQLMNSLKGSAAQDLKNKGADKLEGYGALKEVPPDLIDLLLKRLIYEGVLSIDSVLNNGSGYHIDVVGVRLSFLLPSYSLQVDMY